MTNIQFQPPTPTIQFEVKLENSGHMHITALVPGDEATANLVAQALMQTQPFGPGWDAEYRSLYLLSGAGTATTPAELQAIAVPHWRKLRGTIRGQELNLTERSTSSDGENWQPYPEADPNALVSAEAQNPVFAQGGEVLNRYATLQWREGRIDIDPEPEGDLLEVLEQVVQMFNGLGDADWKARHEQFGGDPKVVPDAKRTGFEVRKLAPVFSAEQQPFMRVGELEFWPLIPLEYSRDGKKWERYTITDNGAPLPVLDEPEPEDTDPFAMLSQMFDIQSAAVTVHAGGQLDWDENEIPEQHREALRASILQATGAGNAANWAAQTGDLNPGGAAPQAVRLQVMKALLDAAPGMLDQSYAPVAFTTDGENWQDIRPQFEEEETVSGE